MALIPEKTVDDFYLLLRTLYGDTYGDLDDSSLFQRQLRSWAVLLHLGRETIDIAFRQAYPSLSDALINEWEKFYRLPNDTARTIAERQIRLRAQEELQRGAARTPLEEAMAFVTPVAQFEANTRTMVEFSGGEDRSIFQTTLQLSNEEFFDAVVRDAIERIFTNTSPAKNVGAMNQAGRGHTTIVELGATHGSPNHYMNRDALTRQSEVDYDTFQQAARIKSFGPASRLNAEDFDRIQKSLMAASIQSPSPTAIGYNTDPGSVRMFFSSEIPGSQNGSPNSRGPQVIIDSTRDWRDRIVAIHILDMEIDIRPGEADDDGTGAEFTLTRNFYTGPGNNSGSSTAYKISTSYGGGATSSIDFYARDTDGSLIVQRRSDSDDRYAIGYIVGSPPISTPGTVNPSGLTVHDFARYEDMSELTTSFLEDVRNAESLEYQEDTVGQQPLGDAIEAAEFRRVMWCIVPQAGFVAERVVDDSRDYRDRLLFLSGPFDQDPSRVVYPGFNNDGAIGGIIANTHVYYTRQGRPGPLFSVSDQSRLELLGNGTQLYARESDGALVIGRNPGDSIPGTHSFAFMIHASHKLNKTTLVPSTGQGLNAFPKAGPFDEILPVDLNDLQDERHMAQVVRGKDSHPLGKIVRLDPPISYEWEVRGEPFRQPLITSALCRFGAIAIGANTIGELDRRHDWRDRIITVYARVAASLEAAPGGADEDGDTSTFSLISDYTGAGGRIVGTDFEGNGDTLLFTNLRIYADADTGYLMMFNDDDAGIFVGPISGTFWIHASPQLGPRSVTTADARLTTQAEDPRPSNFLADPFLTPTQSGIVGRWRADLGVMSVNGKTAAWADQSGNGHHLVQVDTSLRFGAPEPVSGMLGRQGLPASGLCSMRTFDSLPASVNGYHVFIVAHLNSIQLGDLVKQIELAGDPSTGSIRARVVAGPNIEVEHVAGPTPTTKTIATRPTIGVSVLEIDFVPSGGAMSIDAWHGNGANVSAGSLSPGTSGEAIQKSPWELYLNDGHLLEVIVYEKSFDGFANPGMALLVSAYATGRYGI